MPQERPFTSCSRTAFRAPLFAHRFPGVVPDAAAGFVIELSSAIFEVSRLPAQQERRPDCHTNRLQYGMTES